MKKTFPEIWVKFLILIDQNEFFFIEKNRWSSNIHLPSSPLGRYLPSFCAHTRYANPTKPIKSVLRALKDFHDKKKLRWKNTPFSIRKKKIIWFCVSDQKKISILPWLRKPFGCTFYRRLQLICENFALYMWHRLHRE